MDILKIIKITTVLLLLYSCRDIKYQTYIYPHKHINIENWNIKEKPVKSAVLFCYKKDSDFKILEKKISFIKAVDNYRSHKMVCISFDSLHSINLNKDYKLIINDSLIYKLKDIKTSYTVMYHGSNNIDSVYNLMKSININDLIYKYEKPRHFFIPKDTYTLK